MERGQESACQVLTESLTSPVCTSAVSMVAIAMLLVLWSRMQSSRPPFTWAKPTVASGWVSIAVLHWAGVDAGSVSTAKSEGSKPAPVKESAVALPVGLACTSSSAHFGAVVGGATLPPTRSTWSASVAYRLAGMSSSTLLTSGV